MGKQDFGRTRLHLRKFNQQTPSPPPNTLTCTSRGEKVHPQVLAINFIKERTSKKLEEGFEEASGVQFLPVKA